MTTTPKQGAELLVTAHVFIFHDFATGFRCCADALP